MILQHKQHQIQKQLQDGWGEWVVDNQAESMSAIGPGCARDHVSTDSADSQSTCVNTEKNIVDMMKEMNERMNECLYSDCIENNTTKLKKLTHTHNHTSVEIKDVKLM